MRCIICAAEGGVGKTGRYFGTLHVLSLAAETSDRFHGHRVSSINATQEAVQSVNGNLPCLAEIELEPAGAFQGQQRWRISAVKVGQKVNFNMGGAK